MVIDKKTKVYQYKYKDNVVYPDLIRCPKLKSGNVSLLMNV